LQKRDRTAFVDMMQHLNLAAPTHLTEALRTNMSGGKTVQQMLSDAAQKTPFMSLDELQARLSLGLQKLVVLDVREKEAYLAGHIPGARHLPRGQLELRVNTELPDPPYGNVNGVSSVNFRSLPPRCGLGYLHARRWMAA
jgi:hypothetical protein